jgi:hypothetical protein
MTLEKFFQMDAIREEQEEAARKQLHHEKRTEARKSRTERRKNQAKDTPKVATPNLHYHHPQRRCGGKRKISPYPQRRLQSHPAMLQTKVCETLLTVYFD